MKSIIAATAFVSLMNLNLALAEETAPVAPPTTPAPTETKVDAKPEAKVEAKADAKETKKVAKKVKGHKAKMANETKEVKEAAPSTHN